MRDLTIAAVSTTPTGADLVLRDPDGGQYRLAVDDRLLAVVRGEQPSGQLTLGAPTTLTPREIQQRVRAGATVAELRALSGMPLERIEAFAVPVLDERRDVARRARTASVRVAGDPEVRSIEATLDRALDDGTDVEWDAWRREDGRWVVATRWSTPDGVRTALWQLDVAGRSAVAHDEEARGLLGIPPAPAPAPRLAVVRADGPQPADQLAEPPTAGLTTNGPTTAGPTADAETAPEDDTPTGPVPVVPTSQAQAEPRSAAPRRGRHPAGQRRPAPDAVPSFEEIMFGRRAD
jgi:hypothetical protein